MGKLWDKENSLQVPLCLAIIDATSDLKDRISEHPNSPENRQNTQIATTIFKKMLAGENPEATKKVKQFYKNFYLKHPKYEFDDAIDFLENEFDLSNIKFHYSKKFLKDYSIARERYSSLKERYFERLISELFFKHYFIKKKSYR